MEIETGEGTGGGQSSRGSYGKRALPEWQRYLLILLGEAYMVIKRAQTTHPVYSWVSKEHPTTTTTPV